MVEWNEECDVLVVGSGGGGCCGAYTAAREGLAVTLVEATDKFGGTTAYSGGGGVWFPTNAVLRRAGTTDTIDDALTYFHAVVGDRTPRELQDAYVTGGAPLIDYLEQDEHFSFDVLPWPDYFGKAPKASAEGRHIAPTPIPAADIGELRADLRPPLGTDRLGEPLPDMLIGGQSLIGRFLLALSTYPQARTHLNTSLEEVVVEDGRVVGAIVEHDGRRRAIRARRGVLLAAGGFEANDELRTRYGVPGVARDTMGPWGNLGKAHVAGIEAGADTDLMDQAWWSPGMTHPDGRSAFALWFTGGIFVDDAGRRFVNESAPYDRLGRDIIERMDEGTVTLPYWMIYDHKEGDVPPVHASNVPMVATEEFVAAGLWKTADSLEELAEQIGVPADALVESVARYNKMAEKGVDEDFGRGDEPYDRAFAGGGSPLVPIDQGPFHAAAFGISDLGTKGGLRTDTSARVVDASGTPIPGLYAAGNTMAAASGTVYPGGGNPIGASMLFSHLAVRDMAATP
ncbi:FAD-binding protein [Rhodococcus triatomae]|uniref:3-oxosteroid 1-dehydrogenase n=1 Tax=Rhodococcus triatomae TaxID=300028 RepID=A0A1G8L116_9NOCA|nr:FAD-binding protein [Rhodococcus triatomae]QNG20481.1 FAD-binding protein [Rhodococcus triatomae]QNG23601.1 FAD-binding protein [Rhodococcus triatomae]SDI49379.1 FAD binding domain-containing protein [Rhodococcus triatomae]